MLELYEDKDDDEPVKMDLAQEEESKSTDEVKQNKDDNPKNITFL